MTEKRFLNLRRSLRKNPHPRVKVECRAAKSVCAAGMIASILDISEGGVRLAVKKKMNRDELMEVTFNCPKQANPIKRLATVCWVQSLEDGQYCVGLQFEKRLLFAEVLNISNP